MISLLYVSPIKVNLLLRPNTGETVDCLHLGRLYGKKSEYMHKVRGSWCDCTLLVKVTLHGDSLTWAQTWTEVASINRKKAQAGVKDSSLLTETKGTLSTSTHKEPEANMMKSVYFWQQCYLAALFLGHRPVQGVRGLVKREKLMQTFRLTLHSWMNQFYGRFSWRTADKTKLWSFNDHQCQYRTFSTILMLNRVSTGPGNPWKHYIVVFSKFEKCLDFSARNCTCNTLIINKQLSGLLLDRSHTLKHKPLLCLELQWVT